MRAFAAALTSVATVMCFTASAVSIAMQDTEVAAVMAAAERGDPDAQYELAWMYFIGTDVPKDDAKSARWCRRAAEQGHAAAQVMLGSKYEIGDLGMRQDYAEAVWWYRRAAEQGYAPGQFALAGQYREGLGVPQDYTEAVQWYRRAAEQGHPNAQFSLGEMHSEGLGVPQDYTEAVQWYRRAAETEPRFRIVEGRRWVTLVAGQAEAQNNLGLMYAEGRGVAQDEVQAVRWYRRAAEQHLAAAQRNLGLAYAEGRGVVQNDTEAVRWFRRAARQGLTAAQNNLAFMYSEGRGVLKDSVLAHMWLNIAGANGNERARTARDALEADLSRTDIARATELARMCIASDYEECEP